MWGNTHNHNCLSLSLRKSLLGMEKYSKKWNSRLTVVVLLLSEYIQFCTLKVQHVELQTNRD